MRCGGWIKLTAAMFGLVFWTASASAFYWAGWPGSSVVVPPVQSEQRVVNPNIPLPPIAPQFDPPGVNSVPEPATLMVFGTGLAMLAGTRLWKKRRAVRDQVV